MRDGSGGCWQSGLGVSPSLLVSEADCPRRGHSAVEGWGGAPGTAVPTPVASLPTRCPVLYAVVGGRDSSLGSCWPVPTAPPLPQARPRGWLRSLLVPTP